METKLKSQTSLKITYNGSCIKIVTAISIPTIAGQKQKKVYYYFITIRHATYACLTHAQAHTCRVIIPE